VSGAPRKSADSAAHTFAGEESFFVASPDGNNRSTFLYALESQAPVTFGRQEVDLCAAEASHDFIGIARLCS